MYKPTTSRTFSVNVGSFESLNGFTKRGLTLYARHTYCMRAGDVPSSTASVRVLQWVA